MKIVDTLSLCQTTSVCMCVSFASGLVMDNRKLCDSGALSVAPLCSGMAPGDMDWPMLVDGLCLSKRKTIMARSIRRVEKCGDCLICVENNGQSME